MGLASGHVLRDRFEVRGVLGRGGMGTVYRAFDRSLGVEVALKAVRHRSPQAFYRLKAEFRALADLRHRHLVRLGELFGGSDEWFFSMELVEGMDFLHWVRGASHVIDSERVTLPPGPPEDGDSGFRRRRRKAPHFHEARLRGVLAQLGEGLAALHAAGRVHRDVKPSNVVVEADTGRLVVLDFGLTRDAHAHDTGSGEHVEGTAAYMSPEQAKGMPAEAAADWYAVGVMLFEALTGCLPFDGPPLQILAQKVAEDPPSPSELTVGIAPDLEEACVGLLRRDPAERGGAELLREIASAQGQKLRSASVTLPVDDSPFVGRDREIHALRRAFDDGRRGKPVMARVLGESGVGKTAVVRRFLDELAEAVPELVLLEGRCYAHELVPYKAWDGVVDAISRQLRRIEGLTSPAHAAWLLPKNVHDLARVFPVLQRVPAIADLVPPSEKVENPERLRRRAFDALRELLRNLGREGPVVVWIDDFHWADRDSRLLLEDLLAVHDAPPLLLVTTERPSQDETPPGVHARALPLAPLESSETLALARELGARYGQEVPEGELAGVVEESGGHPMFLQQLIRRASKSERPGSLRLDDVIRTRVARLEPSARRLLEVICVSGVPLALRTLGAATGLETGRVSELLSELEGEQLVRSGPTDAARLEPFHDRIREAVIDALEPDERARHHAALATALGEGAAESEDDRDVVRHLAEAGHRERAARAAEAAAERATRSLAFDRASELYRMALALGRHTPSEQLRLRLALSDALANAGQGALEAAKGFLEAADAADTSDPDEALTLRTRALEQLAMSGHTEQAMELLRSLCIAVGVRLPRTKLGALFSLLRRRLQIRLRGLPERLDAELTDSMKATESPIYRLYTAAFVHLPILDPILANELHARTLVDALREDDTETLALCLSREAGVCLTFNASNVEQAQHAVRLATPVFGTSPNPDHQAWLTVGNGLRHYFTGHFERALTEFRRGLELWSSVPVAHVANISQVSVFAMGCLRYMGQLSELRSELDRARRDAAWRGNRYLWTLSTVAFGLPILLQDGLEASRRDLEQLDLESPLVRTGANGWYLARAEAEEALYDDRSAAELAEHVAVMRRYRRTQFGLVVTWGAELVWLLGRLHLARADAGVPGEAKRALKLAKNLLRRPLSYARIFGQALLAGARHRLGDLAGSRAALEECAVRAELHGHELVAEAARLRLVQLGFGSASQERSATRFFQAQRVRDLEATLRLFMPGFREAALPAGDAPRLPAGAS